MSREQAREILSRVGACQNRYDCCTRDACEHAGVSFEMYLEACDVLANEDREQRIEW